jgi:hypothetical protein
MLKIVGILALVGLIAGAAFASAASVGPMTAEIQAGAVDIPDGDGIDVEYQTQLGGTGDFVIQAIILTGIDAPDGYYVLASLIEDDEGYPFSGIAVQSFLRASAAISGGTATIDQIYKSGWVPLSGANYPLAENVRGFSVLIKSTQD